MVHNKIFYEKGGYLQRAGENGAMKLVPFPLCVAFMYGDKVSDVCPDFVLNMDESWVFIRTPAPLPEGTSLKIHFYIPPDIKLLAEVNGAITAVSKDSAHYPQGMFIKFSLFSRWRLRKLEDYVEGQTHLIDKIA